MSFGVSVSAMINSLKRNSRPRNKKSYFDRKRSQNTGTNNEIKAEEPKLSPEERKTIQEKLKRENQRETFRNLIIAVSVGVALFLAFRSIFI